MTDPNFTAAQPPDLVGHGNPLLPRLGRGRG